MDGNQVLDLTTWRQHVQEAAPGGRYLVYITQDPAASFANMMHAHLSSAAGTPAHHSPLEHTKGGALEN